MVSFTETLLADNINTTYIFLSLLYSNVTSDSKSEKNSNNLSTICAR
ncbi:3134_t:CDS:2 [Cetraspora pellucida]|uniref:3134_t:CDS:1 n=1 Tax=Cetraspora pellucida TaxID=1433469 RepID=A0A9N9E793_9GLOM|nr:3134_t:CDS:2 [Cetraspora pellucida]